jgi:hypothetical protein
MDSIRGLDLLLLPSSIGIIDLIRIHKLVIKEKGLICEPVSLSSEKQSRSPLRSETHSVSGDSFDQHVDNSFLCESPTPNSLISYNRDEEDRAPCPLQIVSKSVRRRLHFDDNKFSEWFEEVFPDIFFI